MARLTDNDLAAWATYARSVTPLPGRSAPAPHVMDSAPSPAPPQPRLLPIPLKPVRSPPHPGVAIGAPPGGLDAATWHRFRSGRTHPSRRLDLHGHTAQRAFHALCHFVKLAHADHVRCVEIVTGRGSTEGTGVIRHELPLWLNLPDLQHLVLAATYPHPGNPGAVRLLLRRTRSG